MVSPPCLRLALGPAKRLGSGMLALFRMPCRLLVLMALLAACARFPVLDDMAANADAIAPFPRLIPLAPLIAQADALANLPPPPSQEGRISALNARAAALRGPIIDPDTRARMQAGVDTRAFAG